MESDQNELRDLFPVKAWGRGCGAGILGIEWLGTVIEK